MTLSTALAERALAWYDAPPDDRESSTELLAEICEELRGASHQAEDPAADDHEQLVLLKGVVRGLELRIEKLEGRAPAFGDERDLCVCGHPYRAHGEYGSGGRCGMSAGPYHQCGCPKWQRAGSP